MKLFYSWANISKLTSKQFSKRVSVWFTLTLRMLHRNELVSGDCRELCLCISLLYFLTHTACLSTQNKYWLPCIKWSPSYLSTSLPVCLGSINPPKGGRERLEKVETSQSFKNCSTLDCTPGRKCCVTILKPTKKSDIALTF